MLEFIGFIVLVLISLWLTVVTFVLHAFGSNAYAGTGFLMVGAWYLVYKLSPFSIVLN